MIDTMALGALIGLHVATWGAYKDTPYEGFQLSSHLRSVAVAVVTSLLVSAAVSSTAGVVVTIGVVYALERVGTEWWKAILREEDQSRYTIPMRLAFRGRPVQGRGRRYAVGLLLLAALVLGCWALTFLQHSASGVPPWSVVLGVGGVGGWATAVGGAWKDAPVEGFSRWKFLRSPAVATAWALPLSLLTTDWLMLCLASAGFAVASIETYKTFLTKGRPPGKFADRPVLAVRPALRQCLACGHAALWGIMALTLAGSLADPVAGLTAAWVRAMAAQLPELMLETVVAVAATLALMVTGSSARRTLVEVSA